MKPGDRVRVIAGPPSHPYEGWKIGRKGRVVDRLATHGGRNCYVLLDGDDEAEEWWTAYLEVCHGKN